MTASVSARPFPSPDVGKGNLPSVAVRLPSATRASALYAT